MRRICGACDIALADATGGRIHIMHVSSAGSVELIRRAKLRGIRITTEVCPHHFALTECDTIRNTFVQVTRTCKNAYAKGKKSFEILATLNPAILRQHLPSFARCERVLDGIL